MHPEFKKVLEEIRFIERFQAILDEHNEDRDNRFERPDPAVVKSILIELGYESKYFKKGHFFQLWAVNSSYDDAYGLFLRVDVHGGSVELLVDISVDGKWEGGPINWLPRDMGFERILCPFFHTYEELEVVLKKLLALYEDIREACRPLIDRELGKS